MPELISDPTLLSYTRLKCSGCGKDVSTPIHAVGELIVRAYIECPECIEGRADPLPPAPASEVIVNDPYNHRGRGGVWEPVLGPCVCEVCKQERQAAESAARDFAEQAAQEKQT
jgi:DNA-directed RNA polymerase subunit RPC12/RpoP